MHRRSLLTLATASLFASPALAAAAPPPGEHPIVIGTSYVLPSAILGEDRRINVWLPPSYGQGESKYPVLYLLDGGEEEDFHHISGLARISGEYGVTREFIVVGIESGAKRRAFMTFPSADPNDLKAIPVNGDSAKYRRFVVEEVRRWVEARYRISGERVLMGESLAGLFTVETLLRQPAAFDSYVAVDPSLWWNKGSLVREKGLPGWKALDPVRDVVIAYSKDAAIPEMQSLAEGIKAVTWSFALFFPDQSHASIYHPAAMQAFRLIFAPPAPAPAPAH